MTAKGFPRPVAVDASLTNNHLQYALTWFALAFLLIVMSGLLIRQTAARARLKTPLAVPMVPGF